MCRTIRKAGLERFYDHNTYLKEKREALVIWERELLRIVGSKP